MSPRRSVYDPAASFNYLRLAWQAMNEDQEQALRTVLRVRELASLEERLGALAAAIVEKTRRKP